MDESTRSVPLPAIPLLADGGAPLYRALRFVGDVPTDARATIERQADEWNTTTCATCKIGFADDAPFTVRMDPALRGHGYDGFTDETGIRLMPGLTGVRAEHNAAHELGHLLGLGHLSGDDVMNPRRTTVARSAADKNECRRVGACEGATP